MVQQLDPNLSAQIDELLNKSRANLDNDKLDNRANFYSSDDNIDNNNNLFMNDVQYTDSLPHVMVMVIRLINF